MRRVLGLALVTLACLTDGSLPATSSPASAPADPQGKIQFRDAGGRPLLTLRAKGGGYRFYDGQDAFVGEGRVQGDRVKLRDARDLESWKIKRKDNGAEIEDASGQRLYRIKVGGGGEWELADVSGVIVAKGKPKENGYEVRDGRGATLAKVKVRQGKLVFETEAGRRLTELEGTTEARAGMWFAVERFSLPERGALFVYFLKVQR